MLREQGGGPAVEKYDVYDDFIDGYCKPWVEQL